MEHLGSHESSLNKFPRQVQAVESGYWPMYRYNPDKAVGSGEWKSMRAGEFLLKKRLPPKKNVDMIPHGIWICLFSWWFFDGFDPIKWKSPFFTHHLGEYVWNFFQASVPIKKIHLKNIVYHYFVKATGLLGFGGRLDRDFSAKICTNLNV